MKGLRLFSVALIAWCSLGATSGLAYASADNGTEDVAKMQYETGMRLARDKEDAQAREWFARSAAGGYPPAYYALGYLYFDGRGVPRDDRKAVELFRKAADRGVADAQYMMGVMYAVGRGVEKDSRRSIQWMRKAAGHGHPGARKTLQGLFGPTAVK
ncbi:tetratricopeptide repeat protein [Endothiovibrio diazotrophicus]